jgi:hypothetical protein
MHSLGVLLTGLSLGSKLIDLGGGRWLTGAIGFQQAHRPFSNGGGWVLEELEGQVLHRAEARRHFQ